MCSSPLPLIACAAIENDEQDPAQLAVILKEAMTKLEDYFDQFNTVNEALTTLKSVLSCLWGAANNKVPLLERLAYIDDRCLQK